MRSFETASPETGAPLPAVKLARELRKALFMGANPHKAREQIIATLPVLFDIAPDRAKSLVRAVRNFQSLSEPRENKHYIKLMIKSVPDIVRQNPKCGAYTVDALMDGSDCLIRPFITIGLCRTFARMAEISPRPVQEMLKTVASHVTKDEPKNIFSRRFALLDHSPSGIEEPTWFIPKRDGGIVYMSGPFSMDVPRRNHDPRSADPMDVIDRLFQRRIAPAEALALSGKKGVALAM